MAGKVDIAIFGASGFTGRHIVHEIVASGFQGCVSDHCFASMRLPCHDGLLTSPSRIAAKPCGSPSRPAMPTEVRCDSSQGRSHLPAPTPACPPARAPQDSGCGRARPQQAGPRGRPAGRPAPPATGGGGRRGRRALAAGHGGRGPGGDKRSGAVSALGRAGGAGLHRRRGRLPGCERGARWVLLGCGWGCWGCWVQVGAGGSRVGGANCLDVSGEPDGFGVWLLGLVLGAADGRVQARGGGRAIGCGVQGGGCGCMAGRPAAPLDQTSRGVLLPCYLPPTCDLPGCLPQSSLRGWSWSMGRRLLPPGSTWPPPWASTRCQVGGGTAAAAGQGPASHGLSSCSLALLPVAPVAWGAPLPPLPTHPTPCLQATWASSTPWPSSSPPPAAPWWSRC